MANKRARALAAERHLAIVTIILDGTKMDPPRDTWRVSGPVSEATYDLALELISAMVAEHGLERS